MALANLHYIFMLLHSRIGSPLNNEVKDSEEFQVPPSRRRRSASCHVLSSSKANPGFHTIQEEPVGEELQRILEGDK